MRKNKEERSLEKRKDSYKFYIVGFIVIGFLSATTFHSISTYEADVEKLAYEAINKKNQNQEPFPDSPPVTEPTNKLDDASIVEKEDIVLKPGNSIHYIPSFIMQNNHIEIEGESMNIIAGNNLPEFLRTSLNHINEASTVTVTELESAASEVENTQKMTLSQYKIDYEKRTLEKNVHEKIANGSTLHKEQMYVNADGLYLSYPSAAGAEILRTSYGESKMTKDNIVEKATLYNIERSPYELVKEFTLSPQHLSEFVVAESNSKYVLYRETKEDLGEAIHYKIEAYWFNKANHLPIRAISYTTTIEMKLHTYTLNEYVYDNWNEPLSINFPSDFEQKIHN